MDLKDYKKIRTPFVFFDETGSINDRINRFFGLGMIKCMQPYFLDHEIRKVRQKYHFFDEIKWNTLSKVKLKVIREILELVFKTQGIYFSALIVNKDTVDFKKDFNNDPYRAYQEFTERLLTENITNNEVLFVLADYITVPDSIRFEVEVKHQINSKLKRLAIGGVHRVDSKGLNMIQITDLLLGAVIYDFKLKSKLVKGDKNKKEVLKLICKKLETKSLSKSISKTRFKVNLLK